MPSIAFPHVFLAINIIESTRNSSQPIGGSSHRYACAGSLMLLCYMADVLALMALDVN